MKRFPLSLLVSYHVKMAKVCSSCERKVSFGKDLVLFSTSCYAVMRNGGAGMIVEATELRRAEQLFRDNRDGLVLSALSGRMGRLWFSDTAALIQNGVFFFFAGKPDPALIEMAGALCRRMGFGILTPPDAAWAAAIERSTPAKRQTRYSTRRCLDGFDLAALKRYAVPPAGYTVRPIDGELYHSVQGSDWSCDFVALFDDEAHYLAQGLGCLAFAGERAVSGASSYASYPGGIEIEIDTDPAFRRQGLALCCGANLVLACLQRGQYPSWDAQNRASLALAEKLGYRFLESYEVYVWDGSAKGAL